MLVWLLIQGGVSGGALTSAFLTPMTLGMAQAAATSQGSSSILSDGFGIIAFISVTPLIAVQFLGIVYDIILKKEQRAMEAAEMADLEELALLAELTEFDEVQDNNEDRFEEEDPVLENHELIETIIVDSVNNKN